MKVTFFFKEYGDKIEIDLDPREFGIDIWSDELKKQLTIQPIVSIVDVTGKHFNIVSNSVRAFTVELD